MATAQGRHERVTLEPLTREPLAAGDHDGFDDHAAEMRIESMSRRGVALWCDMTEREKALAAGEPVQVNLELPTVDKDRRDICLRLDAAEGVLLAALGVVRAAKRRGFGGALAPATPNEEDR